MSVPSTHQPADLVRNLIYVVDDDDGAADSLKVLLKAFGFEVQSYNSGAQFLADERDRTAGCLVTGLGCPA